MKKISSVIVAAIAVVALTGTADAAKRHKHRVAPQDRWSYDNQYHGYTDGYAQRDYSGRRDPSTWSGPLNAWDKARRDDALLQDHR